MTALVEYVSRRELIDYMDKNLVIDKRSDCKCGWYIFYSAICHHQFMGIRYTCGESVSGAGGSGYCKTPAQCNIMDARVPEKCNQCQHR